MSDSDASGLEQLLRDALASGGGMLGLALSALDAFLQQRPRSAVAHIGRAAVLTRMGRDEEAGAALDTAVELAPADQTARRIRSTHRRRMGRLGEALDDVAVAIQIGPDAADIRIEEAEMRFALGDIDGALAALRQAVALEPTNGEALMRLAGVHEALGHHDEALRVYESAIAADAESASLYRSRAELRAAMGDTESAVEDYDRSLEFDPDASVGLLGKAHALAAGGDFAGALAAVDQVLVDAPELLEAMQLRSLCLVMVERPSEALETLDRLAAVGDEAPELLRVRARALVEVGDTDGALDALSRALADDPRLTPAYVERGQLLLSIGAAPEARHDFKAAVTLDPQIADAHVGLGDAFMAIGDQAHAARSFARALDLEPAHLDALAGHVVAQLMLGDEAVNDERGRRARYVAARDAAEEALALYPDEPWFAANLVTAYRLLDAWDRAAEVAAEALANVEPDDPLVAWLGRERGDALRRWGEATHEPERVEEALAALESGLRLADGEDAALIQELRGHALLHLGRDDAALAAFEAAVEQFPTVAWGRIGAGRVHLDAGRVPDAEHAFRDALATDASNAVTRFAEVGLELIAASAPELSSATAYVTRADCLQWFGRVALAERDLLAAFAIAPDEPDVLNELAWFRVEHGASREALAEGQELALHGLSVEGVDELFRSYLLDTAGWAAYRLGRLHEAVSQLKEATELDPQRFLPRWHLEEAMTALRGASAGSRG